MSDRSYASIAIYAATPEEFGDLYSFLWNDGYLGPEWSPGTPLPNFPAVFDCEEEIVGEMSGMLVGYFDDHPDNGIVLEGNQASCDQFSGDIYVRSPLGDFRAETDTNGDVIVRPDFVLERIRASTDLADFRDWYEETCGAKHFAYLAQYREGRPPLVIQEQP